MIKDLDQMAIDARLKELRDESERLHMPRQASDDVIVNNLKQLGIDVV